MWLCVLFIVSVPIPGGCNLEFEMQVSPWLRVSNNQNMINVDHELAALPLNQGDVFPCESDSLQYEIFHFYIPQRDFSEDSFFNAIRLLRTVKGAQEFGREVSAEFKKRKCVLVITPSFSFLSFLRSERLVSRQQRVRFSVYIRASAKYLLSPYHTWERLVIMLLSLPMSRLSHMGATWA